MFARWLPAAINTRPSEWSRAAIGMALGTMFSVWLCSQVFGIEVAQHLIGPLGASAVLLFAVSSGALAQPWSILGGYLSAGVVSLLVAHVLGRTLGSACLAAGMALILMCWLRCLHPPAGALGIAFGAGGPGDHRPGLESPRPGDAQRLDPAAQRPGLQQPDAHSLPQASPRTGAVVPADHPPVDSQAITAQDLKLALANGGVLRRHPRRPRTTDPCQ